MEFKDWVIASLGLGKGIKTALEMNLRLAAKTVQALNQASSRLDEETLTGAMIGALVSAHPMSAASFPADPASAIEWSGYSKHGSDAHSERHSGADFAMVLSLPDGRLRLAIFQAKSDWSQSATKNMLVVGQLKDVPAVKDDSGAVIETAHRRNQIKALVEAAKNIQSKNGKTISVSDLRWVYYLCQFQDGIKAVALSEIEESVLLSIRMVSTVKVPLSPTIGRSLDALLKCGCRQKTLCWLELSASVEGMLPPPIDLSALVELMPVVVGQEGSKGPKLEFGLDVDVVKLSQQLVALPEPAPIPSKAQHRIKI
ncbi:hypothetical protein [Xanthomonas campestris]|uniref:hypothetical protein n=1 Tax=Xanthomonas campestris TaxID=339 RepID=UPI001D15D83C|nr:hypothetical protein [Xanthomonas campestris]MCC3255048.1 hypothetical protein [Xanthomonas campestris pv. armoraciae]